MNVPKLRFKEFSGEWEKKTFRDIVSLNLVPVEKPNTDYVRLGIRSHCKGTFHELVKIEDLLEADKMFLVPKDNLILNITFAWEHAIAITDENDEGKYVSGRFPTFAFKKNEVPAFYESIIRSKRMKYELGVASPGGAGRNRVLNKELFLDIPVKTTDFEEQTKIAEFVKCIDEKIENQKLIVESLERQKKGLMQKIFSQELRFKDDEGKDFPAWEEKKLGEIATFCGGGTPSKDVEYFWKGNIPWVSSSDITDNVKQITISRFISAEAIKKSATKLIPKQSILIVSRVGVGKVALTNCDLCTSQDFTNIVEVQGNRTFLCYLLKNVMERKALSTQGTSIKGITSNEIKSIVLDMPVIDEQNKIALFLSLLDEKIEKENECLEHWQQVKKGLLQQMFV